MNIDNRTGDTETKVMKAGIPQGSLTEKYLPADYADTFACEVFSAEKIIPDDILTRFWTDFPVWVGALFRVRNFLVKFAGLKGPEKGNANRFEECIRSGETDGMISVPAKSGDETVLLLADRHLDAYMSVHIKRNGERQTVSAITLVRFRNRFGRLYFFFIRPFHGLIVKSMLKRAVGKAVKV